MAARGPLGEQEPRSDLPPPPALRRDTHSEEVGPALGLLADGRGRVGRGRYVDAQLLLAGARRGRDRGGIVAQTPASITCL